jgi:hypothetical protein
LADMDAEHLSFDQAATPSSAEEEEEGEEQ